MSEQEDVIGSDKASFTSSGLVSWRIFFAAPSRTTVEVSCSIFYNLSVFFLNREVLIKMLDAVLQAGGSRVADNPWTNDA